MKKHLTPALYTVRELPEEQKTAMRNLFRMYYNTGAITQDLGLEGCLECLENMYDRGLIIIGMDTQVFLYDSKKDAYFPVKRLTLTYHGVRKG